MLCRQPILLIRSWSLRNIEFSDGFSQRPPPGPIQVIFAVLELFKPYIIVIARSRLLPKCTSPMFFCDKSPPSPNFQKIQYTFLALLKKVLMPLVSCPAIDKESARNCSLRLVQTFFGFSCNYYLGSP